MGNEVRCRCSWKRIRYFINSIEGGNKNDVAGSIKKHYTGTYKNGYLDCIANFEDGAQISYKG